jgi:hypothetical protein
MRSFLTSISLKDAVSSDYEHLDIEMEKERFTRRSLPAQALIQQTDKGREYNYHGFSIQDVTAAAYRAARKTGKQYRFTVVKQKK